MHWQTRNMNPKIESFWIKLGYNITKLAIRNYVYFVAHKNAKDLIFANRVAIIPGDLDIRYYFLDKSNFEYSEKEMIQQINLMAFK